MIILLIIFFILAVVLSPLCFFRTRSHAIFAGLKNDLMNDNNKGIHEDIRRFKMRIKKDRVLIIVDSEAIDYTVQDKLDELLDKLPTRLERRFNMHFENKKVKKGGKKFIHYIAKRR